MTSWYSFWNSKQHHEININSEQVLLHFHIFVSLLRRYFTTESVQCLRQLGLICKEIYQEMQCSLSLAITSKCTWCEVWGSKCFCMTNVYFKKANHVSFIWEILIILNVSSVKSGGTELKKKQNKRDHFCHSSPPCCIYFSRYCQLVISKPGKSKSWQKKKAEQLWMKRGQITGNPFRLKRILLKLIILSKEAVNVSS